MRPDCKQEGRKRGRKIGRRGPLGPERGKGRKGEIELFSPLASGGQAGKHTTQGSKGKED